MVLDPWWTTRRVWSTIGLISLAMVCASTAEAQGDLLVVPTRVVFEGRTRGQEITLTNRGKAPATYRIQLIDQRMTEDGRFEEIGGPAIGERSARHLIRYSPRQVSLAPGEVQAVRLQVRKPAELPEGEYRSHLALRVIPPPEAGAGLEGPEAGEDGIGIRLVPVYGVSLPVIVRHGELSAKVRMSEIRLLPPKPGEPPILRFDLERHGERSVYGDVSVTFSPDTHGEETVVGLYSGLAVYSPNPLRRVRLPLRLPDGVELRQGRLRVAYGARPEEGKGEVWSQGELIIP